MFSFPPSQGWPLSLTWTRRSKLLQLCLDRRFPELECLFQVDFRFAVILKRGLGTGIV